MYSFILSIGLMAGVALAQSVAIGLPEAGAELSTTSNTTFQIQRPVRAFLKSYEEKWDFLDLTCD